MADKEPVSGNVLHISDSDIVVAVEESSSEVSFIAKTEDSVASVLPIKLHRCPIGAFLMGDTPKYS